MQKLNVEYTRNDNRGSLIQVNTGEWKQLNHLIINKGEGFGGHYHKHKKELFYVIKGTAVFSIWNIQNDEAEYIFLKQGECLLIEPNDYHVLYAVEDSEIIELLNEPYNQEDVWTK